MGPPRIPRTSLSRILEVLDHVVRAWDLWTYVFSHAPRGFAALGVHLTRIRGAQCDDEVAAACAARI
jgi:hypothetical protein